MIFKEERENRLYYTQKKKERKKKKKNLWQRQGVENYLFSLKNNSTEHGASFVVTRVIWFLMKIRGIRIIKNK